MKAHKNARTTLRSRQILAERISRGQPAWQVAQELGISRRTVQKCLTGLAGGRNGWPAIEGGPIVQKRNVQRGAACGELLRECRLPTAKKRRSVTASGPVAAGRRPLTQAESKLEAEEQRAELVSVKKPDQTFSGAVPAMQVLYFRVPCSSSLGYSLKFN